MPVFCQKRADDQLNWRVSQNEKIKKLRDQLTNKKKQLSQGWSLSIYLTTLDF